MNRLLHSARAYCKLLKTQYHFTLGRKQKLYKFSLIFNPADFHHLAGLHKLKDLNQLRKNRERIFKDILEEKLTEEDICTSISFAEIEERLSALAQLEEMLDSQDTVFIWLKNKTVYSNIDADYLIVCKNHDKTYYLFAKKTPQDNGIDSPATTAISLFARKKQDYTEGQVRTTLLKKVKQNSSDDTECVLIDRLKL